MNWDEVVNDLLAYVAEEPEFNYKIIIGTDSQVREETHFVTAIVVHRVGKGARYYYMRKVYENIKSLRQRIFMEATTSLEIASKLTQDLTEKGHTELNLEIHLDIGQNGQTKELIRDIVGMITGSGFDAKIKPYSCGASTVADKYTK
ncbi:MAG: ribonuclease H-like YkuK family protein [Syntrophaceticus sp.]